MAICIVVLSICYAQIGIRSEPLLLLCSALALANLRGLEQGRLVNGLLLGICAGLATAVKLSAPSYFAPLLFAAFFEGGRARIACLAALPGFTMGFIAPYLPPGVGLQAHLHFIAGLYRFPIFQNQIIGNLAVVVAFALPLLLWRPGLPTQRERRIAIGLALSTPPIIVVASLEGAGHWHLLPFLPPYLQLLGRVINGTGIETWRRALLVTTMSALTVASIKHNLSAIGLIRQGLQPVASSRVDLAAFLAAHPGDTVAIADSGTGFQRWRFQDQNVWLVAMGQPLVFTSVAWRDMRRPENVDRLIAHSFVGCRVRYWLSATDDPFSIAEYDPRIPRAFHEIYRLEAQTQSFFVWGCREAAR